MAISLLATTAVAFWLGVVVGLPAAGFAVLALILAGYAAVLAVEFSWLQRTYSVSDASRPRALQLLGAWATEVTAAPRVFLWRQPFRSHSVPDHLLGTPAGRRGVLLVHGFFCNRGLWNPMLRRLRSAGVPFVAVNLEPVFGSIDEYLPTIADGVQRLQQTTGLAPLIVAHSMGGLAVRAWAGGAPAAAFHRIVTVASPHAGTRLGARGRGAQNIGQMRVGSEWLARLTDHEPIDLRRRFVCFWSHCDNIVFPTRNATLPGADNRHLEATPHVHMVDHPAVLQEVLRAVTPPG